MNGRSGGAGFGKEWDSESYHRISEPQFAWGMRLVESLNLRGDETVLDAGCGSGKLTAELLKRLPRGRVIAVDRVREHGGGGTRISEAAVWRTCPMYAERFERANAWSKRRMACSARQRFTG